MSKLKKAKGSPAPASGLKRSEEHYSVISELGVRVRAVRESKGLSLAELSEKCGIPGATLSRIENSKMSPTFGVLARVMIALDIDWIDLVGPKRLAKGERMMSFAEPGEGQSTEVRGCSASFVLHSQDTARLLPLLIDVKARELVDVGGLIGHRGEEFCFVLSGKLALHMEGHAPRILKPGASALFDSATPHTYLAAGPQGAKILIVVTRAYGSHVQASANQP